VTGEGLGSRKKSNVCAHACTETRYPKTTTLAPQREEKTATARDARSCWSSTAAPRCQSRRRRCVRPAGRRCCRGGGRRGRAQTRAAGAAQRRRRPWSGDGGGGGGGVVGGVGGLSLSFISRKRFLCIGTRSVPLPRPPSPKHTHTPEPPQPHQHALDEVVHVHPRAHDPGNVGAADAVDPLHHDDLAAAQVLAHPGYLDGGVGLKVAAELFDVARLLRVGVGGWGLGAEGLGVAGAC